MDNLKKIIPKKEERRLQIARIRAMYRRGYSMDAICRDLGVSKTTVVKAVKGLEDN